MFDRLDPQLQKDKQIDIAVRNMLPRFQIAFANVVFQNWAHLERIAVRIERTYINARNYKAPPSFGDSLLPQLAFQDPSPNRNPVFRKPRVTPGVHQNLNAIDLMEFTEDSYIDESPIDNEDPFEDLLFQMRTRPRANVTPRPPGNSEPNHVRNKSNDRCYRCGEVGHYSDVCTKPRRVFCRECGTLGTRRSECTKCPPIKYMDYCRKCGLAGVTTENCTECPENT